MLPNRFFVRPAAMAMLIGFLAMNLHPAFAVDSLAAAASAQKTVALRLFSKDAKVQSAIKTLQSSNYKVVSTDTVPYRFASSDEGPNGSFLVTAWLGRREAYGWTAAFVSAKVNTDSFGPPSVTVVDSNEIEKLLSRVPPSLR